MADLEHYFSEIDLRRSARAKELSAIKLKLGELSTADPLGIASKAVIVLSYSHWEGFYNECAQIYIDFLKGTAAKISDIEWMLLLGVFHQHLEALRDRNHSLVARCDFIDEMRTAIDSRFDAFDPNIIKARSNLNFERLTINYRMLNFSTGSLQPRRNRIDKELVAWRHNIAHGDSPDLSNFDIARHVDFTADLLISLADQFQEAMLAHA